MMTRYGAILALLVTVVAGCGGGGDDYMNAKTGNERHDTRETSPNVWSGQVKTLDKARGVEQTLMKSARQQQQTIDEQSQ